MQAKAFCKWRTKKKNDFLNSKRKPTQVPQFRLATEAEWEYAARGGLENATYPWGGPYTTTDRGCFLANFKPTRGNYAVDGALYTVEAKSYPPNDFGLYNMSGNVAEWTNTAYSEASYYIGSTMNPATILCIIRFRLPTLLILLQYLIWVALQQVTTVCNCNSAIRPGSGAHPLWIQWM